MAQVSEILSLCPKPLPDLTQPGVVKGDSSLQRKKRPEMSDEEKRAWRVAAADALEAAGFVKEADDFRQCGREFYVDVCTAHVEHEPRVVPKTCHLRVCPDCEHREQARKLARYVPAMHDLVNQDIPGYSLKHLTLTTPFSVLDPDAPEKFDLAWKWVERAQDLMFFKALDAKGKLSKGEKRRQRPNLKAHGIGSLITAEFGENGLKLHFHVVFYGPYLDWEKVVIPVWKQVTGGQAEVARIERVDDPEAGIREVTKYATKFTVLDPELVPALAKVLKGKRRFRTYGVMNGLPKQEKEPLLCDCGARRRLVVPLDYLARCEDQGIAPDDEIIALYEASLVFSSDLEISRGKPPPESISRGKSPPVRGSPDG